MSRKGLLSPQVAGMAAVAEALRPGADGAIDWRAFDQALQRVIPHEHLVVDIAGHSALPLAPIRFTTPVLAAPQRDYFDYYRERHPYRPLLRDHFEPVVSTSFPFDPKIFYRSEFYQEFFRPLGFRYFAVGLVYPELRGNFILNRAAHSREFAPWELEFLRLVRPVVIGAVKAAGMIQGLAHSCRAAEVALGEAGYGVFHSQGQELEPANAAAEELLAQLGAPPVSEALAAALKAVGESREPFAQFRRGQQEWELRAVKMGQGRALVLYRNEETLREGRVAAAARAFRLTAREAEVTREVCRGLSNANIAGRLQVTEDTVKQHLKSIFRKVNAASRSELITLLNTPRKTP